MMITTIQGVTHVFDTVAGVEAAQLQTVVVQAEEVRIKENTIIIFKHCSNQEKIKWQQCFKMFPG